jgi:hypothetical protein
VEVDLIATEMDFADLVDHLRARRPDLVADQGRDRCLGSGGFLAGLGHTEKLAEDTPSEEPNANGVLVCALIRGC